MQVQIKRQLKIELDQADITEAVRNYLATNGYNISEDDLAKINYVKSPRDGLRAELNITEESGDAPESPDPVSQGVQALDTKVTTVEGTLNTQGSLPTAEPEPEAPGEIPAPSVADVAPEVVAAVDLVLPAEPDVEEEAQAEVQATEEPVAPVTEGRTKLFM